MKKWICLLLVLTLSFSLCACGGDKEKEQPSGDAAVQDVIAKISAIGKTTLTSGEAIAAAETAYAALSDAQKAAVTNYATLTSARGLYDQLTNAVDLINQIGTVTAESELKIFAAEQAYEMVPEQYRELISNRETLVNARAEFDALCRIATLDAENFTYYFKITNTFSVKKNSGASGYTTNIAGDLVVAPFDQLKVVEDVTVTIRVNYTVTKDDNGDWIPKPGSQDLTISLDATGNGTVAFNGSYTCTMDYPQFALTSYEVISVTGIVEEIES